MVNVFAAAIPFFLISVALEAFSLRSARDHAPDDAETEAPIGYEVKDTGSSLALGVGHLLTYVAWKLVMALAYAGIYVLTPLRLDPGDWWTWVLLFFCDDFAYYCYHRAHHRIRLFWASHVVHHSSQHFNLSTALRADWTPFTSIFFWAPLAAIGFPPFMIFLAISWNLLYQFCVHTEKVRRLPRIYEAIFNTPSHHRVHHGSNEQYLDRNYAGILIIWDRMFGTFEPERERVRYGLTTNVGTHNPVTIAFHEWRALWRDVGVAASWRERFGYMLRGPGWRPSGTGSRPDVDSTPSELAHPQALPTPASALAERVADASPRPRSPVA